MTKGRSHKGQHFIPSSYLSAWTDPLTPIGQTPYVWRFPNTGGEGKRKAPENIFKETDLYTIPMPDGSRDLRIEHGLQQLENGLTRLRIDFIEKYRQVPAARLVKLAAFTCALYHRTLAARDHHRKEWGRLLQMGEEMEERMSTKTPDERKKVLSAQLPRDTKRPSLSMEDVREIVDRPLQFFLPAALKAEVPILARMQSTFFVAPDNAFFITSDNPSVRYDPEMHKRPLMLRHPGLMFPTVEMTLPLSPRVLLAITHPIHEKQGMPVSYVDLSVSEVAALNRRTTAFSDDSLIAHKDKFDPAWIRGLIRVTDQD